MSPSRPSGNVIRANRATRPRCTYRAAPTTPTSPGSEAAEVMLRKRLVHRTAWFLVGAIIFVPASQAFPPLEEDGILIFMGATE